MDNHCIMLCVFCQWIIWTNPEFLLWFFCAFLHSAQKTPPPVLRGCLVFCAVFLSTQPCIVFQIKSALFPGGNRALPMNQGLIIWTILFTSRYRNRFSFINPYFLLSYLELFSQNINNYEWILLYIIEICFSKSSKHNC